MRAFLLHLVNERRLSPSSHDVYAGAIKFFFDALRSRAARALALVALAACVLLDLYSVSVVARAPSLGGQLRSVGGEIVAVGLDPHGALAQSGVREGDVLLRLAGREALPAAFASEPDQSQSWTA